ncbi:6-aminohexanoate hydrolase [Rhodovibrio sodomensis]|uniref:6-aminohexanoate hydrolase n=1 Tax=Rhodovibrio sodomensis TaxID=1088 RepID=A0ABS1DJ30_9PROT|nr:serine hydrolase [Rhodovibrio sodomensis]MBK1670510.1 6-aminohexanoate hydrolase [Rhodovibrio sodomensis]
MQPISRRTVLAGASALVAGPALARADRWARVVAAARRYDQLHAILVAHRGRTVVAEAFRGDGLDAPANVKSVSKSIVALLLGAAIDRGVVPSVEARLAEVAPRLIPTDAEPQVYELTLQDLVTLRAGLERTSGSNYGAWIASDNWVADALSRPFVAEPGGRMLYSTGSFHVLGAALAEASGRDLLTLTRDWLGDPLGIQVPPWTRDPQGYYMGGNQMALSPRAMLRIGNLMRRGGRWQDARILPRAWVEACLTPVTTSPYSGLGYGYGWFVTQTSAGRLGLARGYGGQIIAVAPDAEAVVAITSDPTQPARSGGYFGDLLSLIAEEVLAAT